MKSDLSVYRDALQVMHRPHIAPLLGLPSFIGYWREGYGAEKGKREAYILKRLHDLDGGLHERINKRANLARIITANAENGFIAVVESGMDCDCVTYNGKVHMCEANVIAYGKLYHETSEWADGQFNFTIAKPSEVRDVEYKSRDNVMEAYEDGHPHSVVARSPE